jgi:hypothetical protein
MFSDILSVLNPCPQRKVVISPRTAMARRSCSSVDYMRKEDADQSPTFCLASIWLIVTISRISVSENWRAVLFVILNIAETPEMHLEHCRLHTNSFD